MDNAKALTYEEASELGDEYNRMRELLVQAYNTLVAWQQVIQENYEKDCLEQIQYLRYALDELGIEVE